MAAFSAAGKAKAADLARESGGSVSGNRVRYTPEDVRVFELHKPLKELPRSKLLSLLSLLDIWNLRSFKGQSRRAAAWNAATRALPCLTWLAEYDAKAQLFPDVAAGIAVAFLIVPQGLSYAGIAGLPAVYGLYTDFVPLFLFALYTTSQYLQVGAVAVVSMLTHETLSKLLSPQEDALGRLKAAAAAAASAAAAQRSNLTLAALSSRATYEFNTASVLHTQLLVDTAGLLAFFVGVFSLGIGLLKLGSILNLMGPAVISGFQSAAAISIALGQMKNILGYGKDFTSSSQLQDLISSFFTWQGELNTRATWTGFVWIAMLLIFKHLGRVDSVRVRGYRVLRLFKILGPILVCITAILTTKLAELHLSPGCSVYDSVQNVANVHVSSAVNYTLTHPPTATTKTDFMGRLVTYTPAADAPGCVPLPKAATRVPFLPDASTPWGARGNPWPRDRGIAITGSFGTPPAIRAPAFRLTSGELLTGAVVITLVASLESVAIAKALASKHRQRGLDPSAEYIALGLANVAGSFAGAYPVSGSFSRSALNDEVGATSPVSVLTVACLVGITLKLASTLPIFWYLPQNALSAVVIVALLNLLDGAHFFWLCRYDRKDALIWLATFVAVLLAGVEIGILVAIIVSLALVVIETIFAPMLELGIVSGTNSRRAFRSKQQYPEAATIPGVRVLRVEAPIIFFNAPAVARRLRTLLDDDASDEGRPFAVVLDLSNVPYVDSSFIEEMGDVISAYRKEGVLLALANPNSTVLHKLTITPLLEALSSQFGERHDWVFLTVSDAVDAARKYEPPLPPRKQRAEEAEEADHSSSCAV